MSLLTILIKCVGFIKQAVISYYFGASAEMDAYLVVTDFLCEVGAMFFSSIAIALISIYDEERKDSESRDEFVSNTFVGLLFSSVFLAAAVCLMARPIVGILAPGFSPALLSAAASKLRILSFLLINICISNICIGLLNAEKKFVVAKSIGLIQSVSIISACVFFEKSLGITALYFGFALFYVVENVFLIINVKKLFSFKFHNPFKDARVRKLVGLSVPLFVSSAIVQINVMINKAIASNLEVGSVSAMSYGSFVFATIHSIIIASVTTVLYSFFSEYAVENDVASIEKKSKSSIQLLIALLIPISVICCLNTQEIIRLLYGRGSFGDAAVLLTSKALFGHSLGLVFIAIRDVYLQVLYAFQKMKIAMINGVIGVIINLTLSLLLSRHIGILGITIADSIAYLVLMVLSYCSTKKLLPDVKSTFSKRDFLLIGVTTIVTVISGYVIHSLLIPIHFFLRLMICGIVVFGCYYALMVAFKHESMGYIESFILRKRTGK